MPKIILSLEVFVGVDMIGSLGKYSGKGCIVKLVDCNNDGIMDSHTVFAEVDNPRGIILLGDGSLFFSFFGSVSPSQMAG